MQYLAYFLGHIHLPQVAYMLCSNFVNQRLSNSLALKPYTVCYNRYKSRTLS